MSDSNSYYISIDNVENTQILSQVKETAEEIKIDSLDCSYTSQSPGIEKFFELYDRYKALLENYVSILIEDVGAMEQMMQKYDEIDEEQTDKLDEGD